MTGPGGYPFSASDLKVGVLATTAVGLLQVQSRRLVDLRQHGLIVCAQEDGRETER